jgi:hypothetical protein
MIGGRYEYLLSSLPTLYFENTDEAKQRVIGLLEKYQSNQSKQFNAADILDNEVHKFFPDHLFQTFRSVNLTNIHNEIFQSSKSKVLSEFSIFRNELLSDLKDWRTTQNGGMNKAKNKTLEEILKKGTPLEKEIQLMRYQWEKLEDFAAGHFYDFESLFTYKIKLLILLRWWSFDDVKGLAIFNKLTTIS